MEVASNASLGRRIAFLAAPYAAFVLLLLSIEGLVRWTRPPIESLEFLMSAPKQRAAFTDRQKVNVFEGDPLLFWRLRPNLQNVIWDLTLVSTSAQGLRHDRPLTRKPPGRFRIVCVGDSVTFGYRVPRVVPRHPEDYDAGWLPYPRLLEALLRARYPGRDIEVVPLAVPGYSSHQGLAWFRREIDVLDADIVTACFGWNDIDRLATTDAVSMDGRSLPLALRTAVLHSQAMMAAVRWLRPGPTGAAVPPVPAAPRPPMRVPMAAYVANLLELAGLATAHGAEVVLIGPVYRDRLAHPPEGDEIAGHRAALREASSARGLPYLEIPELTEASYPGNDGLFEEHIHPNHKGHRLLAERLEAFLVGEGLTRTLAAKP